MSEEPHTRTGMVTTTMQGNAPRTLVLNAK
jgi:hypothetical protein